MSTKGTRGGASCLWVAVCPQGHRPQLEGIYRKPLVHTEWVALSQDTASSGPLAKLAPAGPGQGQNCQPKEAMHIGEFSHYLFMNM